MDDGVALRQEAKRLFELARRLNDAKITAAVDTLAWELERRARELEGRGTADGE